MTTRLALTPLKINLSIAELLNDPHAPVDEAATATRRMSLQSSSLTLGILQMSPTSASPRARIPTEK
jgi:hypothetical protein